MRFQWFSIPDMDPQEMYFQTSPTVATVEPEVALGPIPFDNMWEADRYWMPLLLAKRHFVGRTDFKKVGEDRFELQKWWFGVNPDERNA